MTAKKPELPDTAEERRQLLDSLAGRYQWLDKDELRLHDRLATQVAKDEEDQRDFKKLENVPEDEK